MLIKKLKLRANEHPLHACLFSLQALQNATSDISYFQLKIIPTVSVPYKRKKVRNFFRHFRTEILRLSAFFSLQKPAFLFPAKNRRQLWFTAPRSGMWHKARGELAELRRRTFFFFFYFWRST